MLRRVHIATFGDGWDMLAELGSTVWVDGDRAPVVSFGAFRVPTGERGWDYWRLRRRVRDRAVAHIARVAPEAMVIALDARGRARADRAKGAGSRLATEVRRLSRMLYAHDLPVVVVVIRHRQDRERLLDNLIGGELGRIEDNGIAA